MFQKMELFGVQEKNVFKNLCSYLSVFKTIVGRPKRFPFKVKSNLRSVKKQVIDAFVNYDMAEGCDCLVLNKRGECIIRLFPYCKGSHFNIHIWAWFGYFIC